MARVLEAEPIAQEPWGALLLDDVQICPPHPGVLDETVLDDMQSCLPGSRLRLHATVPVERRHFVGEAAWWSADSKAYWERVGALSRHIGARGYTFHAGTREGHTFEEMLDQARRLEQIFECRVGIEGQYPDVFGRKAWFVDRWEEYQALMESGVPFAIDFSHLNILAFASRGIDASLVRDLVTHPNCMEIHVSDNVGASDTHQQMRPLPGPWWQPLVEQLPALNPHALVFSESARPWRDSEAADRTDARCRALFS